jgi:autoinducer-2 kinase
MTGTYLLAIDAGTGSCRAILFTPEGRPAGIGQREYSHLELPGVPGSQVFDTSANWQLICECVAEALRAAGASAVEVLAVSATSMREGMVLYDEAGQEIWACPNVDARATAEAAELVANGHAEQIFRRSGDWVSITAPARFRWIARHEPEIFAEIAHVGMLGDWITKRLTGEYATDASLGSSSGMFNLADRDWSDEVLALCELDRKAFPPVLEPGTVMGQVSAAVAAQTGLRPGTPVVTGGADTQLGLLGIGVQQPGSFTIVGGSFWQHTMLLDEPLIDRSARLRTLCHAEPGQWMVEGIGFYCGIVMRWFRDAFCQAEVQQASQAGTDPYAILEQQAAHVPPGSDGVFGLFSNVMQASNWVHASPGFVGFDVARPERSGRLQCFRAIEESAAYLSRAHLKIIEEISGVSVGRAVLTGGAAKGDLWPQIVADTLGIPVQVPVVKESTALGAAMCAGAGAGLWDSPAQAAGTITAMERTFEPGPARGAYEQLAERWLELYRRSMAMSEDGLARPLWRAPGSS